MKTAKGRKRVRRAAADVMTSSTGKAIKGVVSPSSKAPGLTMLADGRLFGDDPDNVIAALEKAENEIYDAEANGIKVTPAWQGDGTHVVYVTIDDVRKVTDIFQKLGLDQFGDLLPVDFFKEPAAGITAKVDVGPISCRPITKYSLETFKKVAAQYREPSSARFIENAYNASKDPKNDRLFIPRVYIRHLIEKPRMPERVVYNYEPSRFKAALQKIEVYDRMFEELVNTDFRAEVIEDMEAAVEISCRMPVLPNHDLARDTVLYGVLHEICHTLVLHMPVTPEEHTPDLSEDTFFELLRDNVPNLEVEDLRDSVPGRLMFKNWSKALRGVKRYREEMVAKGDNAEFFSQPSALTQRLAIKSYATEMFCDLFPMFLMEEAGSAHPYYSAYGELMTEELRGYFSGYLDLIRRYHHEHRLLVFSNDHLARSGMNEARAFTAAMLMEEAGPQAGPARP